MNTVAENICIGHHLTTEEREKFFHLVELKTKIVRSVDANGDVTEEWQQYCDAQAEVEASGDFKVLGALAYYIQAINQS